MILSPGARLGSFEIQSPLGAGGMGEVWRARDTRLGRDVAIKALPDSLAADPERLARFEREARLLASLNHPNIAGIHGLEEVDGRRYLILECVEGETLAEHLVRGPMPIDEALNVCRQIASAVEAAHESGVVHRDLKPANVKLTPAGEVKVLDFGLAKGPAATEGSGAPSGLSQSPTMVLSMTGAGVILGTAAYMSPEQARGKTVDRRTDIWSFGCLLFECLTGRQLFEGETVSDMVARILEREPDWTRLPPNTPSKVRDLLKRCLDKDAKRRMRDIGDARIELEEAIAARAAATQSDPGRMAAAAPRGVPMHAKIAWVLVAVLTALAAVLGMGRLRAPAPSAAPIRFSVLPPSGTTLPGDAMELAISPDGRTLAIVALDSSGTGHLWLRSMDALAPRMLAGTDNPSLPFWSPDGQTLGFFADSKLKKIPVGEGSVETLADANNGRGGAMNRDGVIVFAPAGGGPLFKIERNGDPPVAVTSLDSTLHQNSHRYPSFLPDGKHFLFEALPPKQGRHDAFVGSLEGGKPKLIGTYDACPVYVEPGYLLYLRGQTVVAQRFDAKQLRVSGDPISLGESPGPSGYSGSPSLSASKSGTLVTLNGSLPNTDLIMIDRNGAKSAALPVPNGRYEGMDFSPDLRQIVVLRTDDRTTQDLWIFDFGRGTMSRFTYGAGRKSFPTWSPDGKNVAYSNDREGPWNIYLKPLGGSGEEQPMFISPTPFKYPERFSWDGRTLGAGVLEEKTGWDLWTIATDDPKPKLYLRTPFNERWGAISPDGHWLAYTSDESGKNEIYVQSFPTAGEKHQVSTAGGSYSLWRRDGHELSFYSNDQSSCLMVDVHTDHGFSAGTPHVVFKLPTGTQAVALTPDFDRLLVAAPAATNSSSSLNVLMNWEALVEKKGK